MPYLRYLFAAVFVCLTLLLTGAVNVPHAVERATAVPQATRAEERADPAATELLSQAVEMLKPERVAWLQAKMWQKIDLGDVSYEVQGTYAAAPAHRLHLQLNVLVGTTRSTLRVLSDGANLWQIMTVAGAKPTVTRAELKTLLHDIDDPRICPEARAEFYQSQGLMGIHQLMADLRKRMIVTSREKISWKTGEVVRLGLVWAPATTAKLAPAGQPWPALLPSKCRLYLDAATLWPHRIEWWGPAKSGGERPILQTEMRDPVFNKALTDRECEREFCFKPGAENVPDLTASLKASVEARSSLLTQQQKLVAK